MYTFRLGYRPPYDWESLIEFLAARAIPDVEFVTPAEYRRTISMDGRAGEIAVRPVPGKNILELQIRYPDPAALFRIVERVRRIFDVGADPAEIERSLKRDPNLKALVRARPGVARTGMLGRVRNVGPRDPRPAGERQGRVDHGRPRG